jgi:ribosomal protein L11 methyltransferase
MFHRVSPDLVVVTLNGTQQSEAPPNTLAITLGAAFPPTHPTTRLCLDLLREALAEGGVNRLVDVGCGSGILGLAAAVWGVLRVVGMDKVWGAAAATRLNARGNALAGALLVIQGSTECLQARFDLVAANLPWEVQMDKTLEFHRLAAPGGSLILSGFRDHQEGPLLEQYANLGWSLNRRLVKYFWHPELPPDISFNWVAWSLTR